MSQYERNLELLNTMRVVYNREPISDVPTVENNQYMFFSDGTHECYSLFKSKAKITTYKSLKWHLLVLWYLNSDLDREEFLKIVDVLSEKRNGFVSFSVNLEVLDRIVKEIHACNLNIAPRNKIRKVVFKVNSGLTKEQKLRIVGELIGRAKKIDSNDIYSVMIDLHDNGEKITIGRVSSILNVSSRTIHRNMPDELKREKEILNRTL
jgi:hypothetical protein